MMRSIIILLCLISCSAFINNIIILKKSNRIIRSKLSALVQVNNLDNKKSIEIEAGQPLSLACVRTDLRLSFQCKQGHCLSCELIMDGKKVRACQTKVPAKKSITVKKKT